MYMGETRETRIEEFVEESDCAALAMIRGLMAASQRTAGNPDWPRAVVPT